MISVDELIEYENYQPLAKGPAVEHPQGRSRGTTKDRGPERSAAIQSVCRHLCVWSRLHPAYHHETENVQSSSTPGRQSIRVSAVNASTVTPTFEAIPRHPHRRGTTATSRQDVRARQALEVSCVISNLFVVPLHVATMRHLRPIVQTLLRTSQ